MRKLKLMVVAVAMLGFAFSSIPAYADGLAPGEGMYAGGFVGHGGGHVSAKTTASNLRTGTTGTYETTDGGIGVSGIEGGGWLGYGYRVGDGYIGLELDGAGGGGKFKITSSEALDNPEKAGINAKTLKGAEAEVLWTAGVGGRVGYYINEDTLFAIKAGMAASRFEAKFGDDSSKYYGGGPRFGASIDARVSAIDPNLSMKLALSYTDYMKASVSGIGSLDVGNASGGNESELSGGSYNMRLGFIYSFFDVNSLF